MTMFSKLFAFLWDYISSRILLFKEQPTLKISGQCQMCGECCRKLGLSYRGKPIKSHRIFKKAVKAKPYYEMFKPDDAVSEDGYLRFSCIHVTADNKCSIHHDRPEICRNYPDSTLLEAGGLLPGYCGYRVEPEEGFEKILSRSLDKLSKD